MFVCILWVHKTWTFALGFVFFHSSLKGSQNSFNQIPAATADTRFKLTTKFFNLPYVSYNPPAVCPHLFVCEFVLGNRRSTPPMPLLEICSMLSNSDLKKKKKNIWSLPMCDFTDTHARTHSVVREKTSKCSLSVYPLFCVCNVSETKQSFPCVELLFDWVRVQLPAVQHQHHLAEREREIYFTTGAVRQAVWQLGGSSAHRDGSPSHLHHFVMSQCVPGWRHTEIHTQDCVRWRTKRDTQPRC